MKKALVLILAAAVTLLSLCSLCGCSEETPVSAVIVYSPHSNEGQISTSAPLFTDPLRAVCRTGGDIALVTCEGTPRVTFQTTIPTPKSGLSESKLDSIAQGYISQLQPYLEDQKAVTPEVNTLKAISEAGQVLQGAVGDLCLVVADSGLSTCSYLNFASGDLLSASPDDIVEELEQNHALPQLSNVCVYWGFLGQTSAPQQPLSSAQLDALRAIWEAVLYAGGAKEVIFTNDFASAEGYTGLPKVSLVAAEQESISPVIPATVLDSASVEFIPDTAQLAAPDVAAKATAPIAAALAQNPDAKIYVVGATATLESDPDFCDALSLQRAETVRDLLVSQGAGGEQLLCRGVGYRNDPWHTDDTDASGRQTEASQSNRRVMLFDVNSEEADILNAFSQR